MRKVTLYFIAACWFFRNTAIGATATVGMQVNATLNASCILNSQNVGFGNILLPLTSQSASSNLNVLCNSGATYTIGMAYGGVYGTGTGVSGNLPFTSAQQYSNLASCTYSGPINGQTYTKTDTYNLSYYWANGCPSSTLYNSAAYTYGLMNGAAHGDRVAYSIQVPNDSTKVWNTGNSSYTTTGTGTNQAIPVKATLVPAQSNVSYPAPDMYSDTVTVTISF